MKLFGEFEKFVPKSKEIKEGNNNDEFQGEREYSLDDAREELNKDLKIQEIISGDNPLEPNEEERTAIEDISRIAVENSEIARNNIRLLMTEIDANNKKIKQLMESIAETEKMESSGEKAAIPVSSYQKMIESLEKLNDEKEAQIKTEEEKLSESYNLN